MLWSSSMRDTRTAALIAVETKRAGHPDRRELLNRIVVSSSLTVILRSRWSENFKKRQKEVIGKTFIINIVRIDTKASLWRKDVSQDLNLHSDFMLLADVGLIKLLTNRFHACHPYN